MVICKTKKEKDFFKFYFRKFLVRNLLCLVLLIHRVIVHTEMSKKTVNV